MATFKYYDGSNWIELLSDAGSSPNLNNGIVITQPAGANALSIKTHGDQSDTGIFYLSEDASYVCNSGDAGYVFSVFDKDMTTDFSSSSTASLSVLQGGQGTYIRGSLQVDGGITSGGYAVLTTNNIGSYKPSYSFSEISNRGEAWLSWGGRSLVGNFAPIDAAMVSQLSANRVAGIDGSYITIERSNDGGSTWSTVSTNDFSDANRKALFTTSSGISLRYGSTNQTTDRLRITMDATNGGVYTSINKIMMYVSTSGSGGCKVHIDTAFYESPTVWHDVGDFDLAGWSGWNVINTSLPGSGALGGSNYGTHNRFIRLTFSCSSVDSTYTDGLYIMKIYMFGGVGWSCPSNLAANGVPYTYDENGNIYCANIYENGTSLSSKYYPLSGNPSGFLTGITSAMVTNALGYTPPTTDHTYNFSGVQFNSGNSGNCEHNCNDATDNGHYYYTSNGPSGMGESTSDGALYVQSYSSSWVAQMAQDYRNGRLWVRGKNNGTWQAWNRIAMYSEIPTNTNQLTNGAGYITAASIPSSLPANGGSADYLIEHSFGSNEDSAMPTSGARAGFFYGTTSATGGDGVVIGMNWTDSSHYGAQLFIDGDPTYNISLRQRSSDGTWNSWVPIITANNISSYAITSLSGYATETWVQNQGYTTNAGTVTSITIQTGTGLTGGSSTAAQSTGSWTIGIASGYKLPTTTEWNNKADASNFNNYVPYIGATGDLNLGDRTLYLYDSHDSPNMLQGITITDPVSNATNLSCFDISSASGRYKFDSDSGWVVIDLNSLTAGRKLIIPNSSGTIATQEWVGNQGYTSNVGTVTSVNNVSPDANGNVSISAGSNYYPIRSYTSGLQISTYSGSSDCQLYVPYMTDSQYGVAKCAVVRSSSISTSAGSTKGNYYGVEKDINDKLFVTGPKRYEHNILITKSGKICARFRFLSSSSSALNTYAKVRLALYSAGYDHSGYGNLLLASGIIYASSTAWNISGIGAASSDGGGIYIFCSRMTNSVADDNQFIYSSDNCSYYDYVRDLIDHDSV